MNDIDKIAKILGKPEVVTNDNITHYDAVDKALAIIDWAETQDNFDLSFIESVIGQYKKVGTVSNKQNAAISNIVTKFNIDLDKHAG